MLDVFANVEIEFRAGRGRLVADGQDVVLDVDEPDAGVLDAGEPDEDDRP